MSLGSSLRIALRALARNKLQTALTTIGMTIGVATVLTMIALGTGAEAAIEQQVRAAGMNLIVVTAGKEAKSIVSVSNGDVDPAEKEGGTTGIKIPRLTNFLAALHHEEDAARQRQPNFDPSTVPAPELMIIADRTTPYRLLIEVLFSAKQKEAGYKHFRLIVQKSFPVTPPRT